MKKRVISLFLAVVMVLSLIVLPVSAESKFSDVNAGAWYESAVGFVSDKGYMVGVSDTTFAPDADVTRAMFVTVLSRVVEAKADATKSDFSDVPDGAWFTGPVAWAAENGIVSGVGEGKFDPNASISRQDACTILARSVEKLSLGLTAGEGKTFSDESAIADYAKEPVSKVASWGLITGFEDGTFGPKGTTTRAQLAIIFQRLVNVLTAPTEPTPTPTPEDPTPVDDPEDPTPVDDPEDPTPVDDPEDPIPVDPNPDKPAQYFEQKDVDGMDVSVYAPAGSLPAGSEMVVTPVYDEATLTKITSQYPGHVIAAVDISFRSNGKEIEPAAPVEVTMDKAGLGDLENLSVIHLDDEGNAETVEDARIIVSPMSVSFNSSKFSVYVIIEQPPVEESRLTINFYNSTDENATPIKTMYVKNDDEPNEIDNIIYDPGIGDKVLNDNVKFVGWYYGALNATGVNSADYKAENAKTIDDIRAYVSGLAENDSIVDGNTLNVYALFFRVFTVTYLNEKNVSIGSDVRNLPETITSTSYTVNMAYIPEEDHAFSGWNVSEGSSNINGYTEGKLYTNGTDITITGNVKFSVNSPAGHWLIFDENKKGATYCAPQFVKDGAVTQRPRTDAEMVCNGFTFGGWYTDKDCTKGNEFTFGGQLTDKTTIYAKWNENTSAQYSIIIWKQNIAGVDENNEKVYDFAESLRLNGTVHANVDTVSSQGTGNNAYARINGKNYTGKPAGSDIDYTGFHLASIDNATPEILSNGTTVVNVYYDRNEYTLSFQIQGYYYPLSTSTSSGYYRIPNTNGGYDAVYLYRYDNRWWRTRTGNSYSNEYTGPVYSYSKTYGWHSIKDIVALYQQDISSNFPIVGTNGVTYNNGERWNPTTNDPFDNVIVFLEIMPNANVVFHLDTNDFITKTMNYYVEALPDETGDTVEFNGKQFVLYKTINANLNYLQKNLDWVDLNGYSKFGTYPAFGSSDTARLTNSDLQPYNYTINFYYERDKYSIRYYDGAYYDGQSASTVTDSMTRIDEAPNADGWGTKNGILFDADISSYGDEESDDYVSPTKTGYHFAGWYIDKDCTKPYVFEGQKMPDHDILVYAKWIENQYRVFLHPNVPASDTSLDWGTENQDMNFRVSSGKTVSLPTGLRGEYEAVGWFSDAACTIPFNASTVLNDTTVTAAYNKATDFTDDMDKYGNGATYNKDVDRTWITKKLDVYLKWRAKLTGANGIGVEYITSETISDALPNDTTLYAENSDAIAGAAVTPVETTKQFLYWMVQSWNGTEYADTEVYVYPGENFTIHKASAKVVELQDSTPDNPQYTYTIRLKAVFAEKTPPVDTHITWYGNGGKTSGGAVKVDVQDVQINKPVDIAAADTFSYPGHIFLGWARVEASSESTSGTGTNAVAKDPSELTEDDLWLAYDAAEDKFIVKETGKEYDEAEVSQIAADEKTPYHDLYAVWQKNYFFVLHSSDGTLEAIEMPAKVPSGENSTEMVDGVYNLQSLVKEGDRYGGYYTNYGGVDSTVLTTVTSSFEKPTVTWTAATTVQNGVFSSLQMEDVENSKFDPYCGYELKSTKNGSRFWARANAGPETNPGNALKPTVGQVYYLKEVDDDYLTSKAMYVFDMTKNGEIQKIFLVTAYDDSYYKAKTIQVDSGTPSDVKFAATFSIISDTNGTKVTVTPNDFVSSAGTAGFVGVLELDEKIIEADKTIQMTPGWTTLDGVYVPGKARTYTINGTKTGFVD